MRFRVGRDALGEAVSFVSRALASRPVVPQLSGMLLDAAAGRLTLSCFDYEVSARVRIDAEVLREGVAIVPGRLLAEITRSLPSRPVEFSAQGDVVNMTCGQAEFGLVCLPVLDYPVLPESPETVGEVDGGVLAVAISQVASSASRDDTLPMLTAVCLDISGQAMTLAATDRYRLAARAMTFTPAEPGLRATALVPARTMVEAARTMVAGVPVTIAFRTEEGGDAATAGRAEGLISLESRHRRLTARLISGEFIKYQSRFPAEFSCHAELPAGPLIEAVRRAALVADRASPVRLSFTHDQVVVEAHAEGRARAAETVAAEFSGDQPVISFNPGYLLDGLAAAAAGWPAAAATPGGASAGTGSGSGAAQADSETGQEADDASPDTGPASSAGRIRLDFDSPAKPAMITWADDGGSEPGAAAKNSAGTAAFRYLLVPQRVPERA